MKNSPNAFTLIELLVVITIIVGLLSLLTPALDKAIYQAQMAVCSSRLHTLANGAIIYAMGHKRSYPYRAGASDPNLTLWQVHQLYNGNDTFNPQFNNFTLRKNDERHVMRTFIDINDTLVDPLTEEIDLDTFNAQSYVFSSYALWFGWRYRQPEGGAGMFKMGNRFNWDDRRYRLLASDADVLYVPGGFGAVQTNHPDDHDKTSNRAYQDYQWGTQGGSGQQAPISQITISVWMRDADVMRGPVDLNFAYDDGSVARFNNVTWQGRQNGQDSLDLIPVFNTASTVPPRTVTVPRK